MLRLSRALAATASAARPGRPSFTHGADAPFLATISSYFARSVSLVQNNAQIRGAASGAAADGATRTEHDTFGPLEVPADKLWGAQTQRSLMNFRIATASGRMPVGIPRALAIIKGAAAASTGKQLGGRDRADGDALSAEQSAPVCPMSSPSCPPTPSFQHPRPSSVRPRRPWRPPRRHRHVDREGGCRGRPRRSR